MAIFAFFRLPIMTNNGPVIYLEDDPDDQDLFKEVMEGLGIVNELKVFANGVSVLDYLRTTTDQPFIIFTDVNVPIMDGLQLRTEICQDDFLKKKSIPYIFLSTNASKNAVEKAYDLQVQGFFQKPSSFEALQQMLGRIINYWKVCLHPNNV